MSAPSPSKGRTSRTSKIRRRTLLLGFAVVCSMFVFMSRYPSAFRLVEARITDKRMYARPPGPPLGVVRLIVVDEKSIATLGRWPWRRDKMAKLIAALRDYGVKVIGLDLFMSERDADDSEVGDSRTDKMLAAEIARHGTVLVGVPFTLEADRQNPATDHGAHDAGMASDSEPISYGIVRQKAENVAGVVTASNYFPPLPVFSKALRGSAFVNIESDEDAVMRSGLMVIRFGNSYFIPLSLALASAYLDNAPLELDLDANGVTRIAIGNRELPVDDSGRMLIHFKGPSGIFPRYSAVDVIAGRVPREDLAGRIAVVGATALGLGDAVATPLDNPVAGVEIHATMIDDILAGDFINRSEATNAEALFAAILLSLAIVVGMTYLSPGIAGLTGFVLAFGYLGYAQYRLYHDHALVGVVNPILALGVTYTVLLGYRYFTEGADRRFLRLAFQHYLHPDVVNQVIENADGLRLGGERRHLAILFADIVNFTARSERTEPEALVDLLDTYMTAMTDIIMASRGVVDKMMGDGIMAFWGAPLDLPNPARAGIDCAIAMLRRLDELHTMDARFADFRVGIGVHVGEVIVGNFGGARRFDYSVIGDAVNFASRLEGLTRHFQVPLLVSQQAYVESNSSYIAREIGMVKVKGKSNLVAIVEITQSSGRAGEFAHFSAAVSTLHEGPPSAAVAQFERLLLESPDDEVSRMWLAKLRNGGPAPNGEMVFEFDTK